MGRVYAVAINTFREAVRDRVLIGVVAFASLVLLFTLALGELSLDQERRVIEDIGLASISFFSVVIAVSLGSSLLYKEIERKTLYVILPRPIHRHEFLLGKYFGIVGTGVVFIAFMGAIQLWVMAFQAGVDMRFGIGAPVCLAGVAGAAWFFVKDRTAILAPLSALSLGLAVWVASRTDVSQQTVLAALALNAGEVFILAAVALLFSSFSTPFLTAVFTFGVWLVGRSADDMIAMQTREVDPQLKTLLAGVAEVAPNLNLFVPGRHTLMTHVEDFGGPWTYVGTSLGYALGYSAMLLVLGALIFRKRDFL